MLCGSRIRENIHYFNWLKSLERWLAEIPIRKYVINFPSWDYQSLLWKDVKGSLEEILWILNNYLSVHNLLNLRSSVRRNGKLGYLSFSLTWDSSLTYEITKVYFIFRQHGLAKYTLALFCIYFLWMPFTKNNMANICIFLFLLLSIILKSNTLYFALNFILSKTFLTKKSSLVYLYFLREDFFYV